MHISFTPQRRSLPFRVAPNSTSTPCRAFSRVLPASATTTRPNPPMDPFDATEGRAHHRSPMALARRTQWLEGECVRLQNLVSKLADRQAEKKANRNPIGCAHQWTERDEGIPHCLRCGIWVGQR